LTLTARASLIRQVRTAVLMVVALTLLLGGLYPIVMTGLARCFFQCRRTAA